MKAITIPEFGPADVLRLEQIPPPEPGPGEVAIDVAFAGANYAEVLFRGGAVDVPLPYVPGIEVSGHVRQVGEGVSGLHAGDPVAALTIVNGGGYAQVAVTDARLVAPLPGPMSITWLAIAGGLPSNCTSAILALEEVARLREGESVLIHAAAGGLGSQLGQAARMLGAGRVVGTVGSPEKLGAARAFRYDDVLLRADLEARPPGGADAFDVVIDPVGGASRRASLDALATGGRLLAIGNASGAADVSFGANDLWLSSKAVMGFNLAAMSATRPGLVGQALRRAIGAVVDGSLRVDVRSLVPLEDAANVHRLIEAGRTTGKLVFEVDGKGDPR